MGAQHGQAVVVQRGDDVRGELGPGNRRRPGERVREPERRRPHDLVGDGRALRDPVLADEQPVVIRSLDVEQLAAPDPGRDGVGRSPFRDRPLDDGARLPHPLRARPGAISTLVRRRGRRRRSSVEREVWSRSG